MGEGWGEVIRGFELSQIIDTRGSLQAAAWACHRRGSQPAATLSVVASDKLFYWLFQQRADRLQPLVASLLPQMEGYVFSALSAIGRWW